MNVTLINPPEKKRVWAGISESMAYGVYCFPPLGLMYLQASLEKRTHHRAEIYDAIVDDLDHPEFDAGLARYDLDVVGISAYTHSLPDVQMTINAVRKRNPKAHITLGGPHPIMFPEYAIGLTGVDSICLGDGDDVIIDLVNALDEGRSLEGIAGLWFKDADGTIVRNEKRRELKDISWQIWPDRSRSRYRDYASCEPVLTQRPYWPASATADTAPDDPRLSDATWQAEFSWMTAQVESSACVCCHSTDLAPDGPSGWYLEAGPIWIDSLDDDGLAMLAGWVDSTAFGAFDAEDNNGFDRSTTGLPTTDVPRMQAFLEGELRRRGLDLDDFSDTPPFGGPLYDQLFYTPEPCEAGQGITADGRIQWTGGDARYIYLLEPDSMNPGVPPNLDLPAGTVWRFDVAWDADPVASGLPYGELPPGTRQAFPEGEPAPVLQPGDALYLYVLRDIYQPITRCTFTMP